MNNHAKNFVSIFWNKCNIFFDLKSIAFKHMFNACFHFEIIMNIFSMHIQCIIYSIIDENNERYRSIYSLFSKWLFFSNSIWFRIKFHHSKNILNFSRQKFAKIQSILRWLIQNLNLKYDMRILFIRCIIFSIVSIFYNFSMKKMIEWFEKRFEKLRWLCIWHKIKICWKCSFHENSKILSLKNKFKFEKFKFEKHTMNVHWIYF